MKSSSRAVNRAGFSMLARWAASSITCSIAPGISRCSTSAWASVQAGSSRPTITCVGQRIADSRWVCDMSRTADAQAM
jgi:hypothetical protein